MSRHDLEETAERAFREFEARERERAKIRETIEPILASLALAEASLWPLGVFGADERYNLGRSRVDLLRVLQIVERRGETRDEAMNRGLSRFTASQP